MPCQVFGRSLFLHPPLPIRPKGMCRIRRCVTSDWSWTLARQACMVRLPVAPSAARPARPPVVEMSDVGSAVALLLPWHHQVFSSLELHRQSYTRARVRGSAATHAALAL